MAPPKSIRNTTDLAHHLGMSRWAVSRAINGQDGVSQATVERVRAAMRDLHFTPSPHARGLRGQRTGLIGVSFRGLDTAVTLDKVSHAQQLLNQRGYRPLFAITGDDARQGLGVMQNFISTRVEGVLLVDAPPPPESARWQRALARAGIPSVQLEPRVPAPHNGVSLDRRAALRDVTSYLLSLGHERFALFGISRQFPLGVPRYEGIQQALAAAGREIERAADIFDTPERRFLGMRYGRELAAAYLAAPSRPRATAIIALDDAVAAGAMWELHRAGLDVPSDCSLFGFDNQLFTSQTNPSLSTVDHNIEHMTAAAVDMLLELIRQGVQARLPAIQIPASLVVRESVGPAAR